MDTIFLEIHNVKNIREARIELPFENGLYTLVGPNGCGKSTIMLCVGQLISNRLKLLKQGDVSSDTSVRYQLQSKIMDWKLSSNGRSWVRTGSPIHFKGMYEGSLFYGTRFADSTSIDGLIETKAIDSSLIADADDYVKDKMSYILHGDQQHYRSLKRIKNREVAKRFGFANLPYFIDKNGTLVNQYRMSSGECLLVSLLHFLYNSIERRSIPSSEKAIVIIDELELALHPVAIVRLMELLNQLAAEHSNLIVYLSSHSPEVIKSMHPHNLYRVINDDGLVELENNCYPSYLIRDLYSNISPDYLILVEDKLARLLVDKILSNQNLRSGRLIHCVPVGGWRNVLQLHCELYSKKVLGTNTKIISVLDGDVSTLKIESPLDRLPHLFLPIQSIEKYLYDVIFKKSDTKMRRIINDKYFIVLSLDSIVAEYSQDIANGQRDDNKVFYRKLCGRLKEIGTDEDVFVNGLCDDIFAHVDCKGFVESLTKTMLS